MVLGGRVGGVGAVGGLGGVGSTGWGVGWVGGGWRCLADPNPRTPSKTGQHRNADVRQREPLNKVRRGEQAVGDEVRQDGHAQRALVEAL